MTRICIFQLNTCGYSPYVTYFLTRGWVCRLQLLLVLANAIILSSESRRAPDHILLSQIRDSHSLKDQVPVYISPRNRVARSHPQALNSLSVARYLLSHMLLEDIKCSERTDEEYANVGPRI
jgi:hypothetical protein